MAERQATLRERKRQLDADLAQTRRDVKRAKGNATAKAAVAAREWSLKGTVRNVVVCLYHFADAVADPAIVYLKRVARQHHWPHRTDEEMLVLICDTFLDASDAEILALTDEAAPSDEGAFAIALDCAHQWAMAMWTVAQNEKGVTPSTAVVLDQFEVIRRKFPTSLRPKAWGTSASASSRKRVSNWRKRFNGRIAAIKARQEIPVDVMRRKESVGCVRHPSPTRNHSHACSLFSVWYTAQCSGEYRRHVYHAAIDIARLSFLRCCLVLPSNAFFRFSGKRQFVW